MELKWFSDDLSNRKQRVMLNGCSSNWSVVGTEVPQENIMSPLLFSVYVNDLPDIIQHSTVNLYADDITIDTSNHDAAVVSDFLCSFLAHVACWIDTNALKMIISKMQMMVRRREAAATGREDQEDQGRPERHGTGKTRETGETGETRKAVKERETRGSQGRPGRQEKPGETRKTRETRDIRESKSTEKM